MSNTRSFTTSLDIAASPEEVWTALTEAGELVRWFPLNAEVSPGAGGSMKWSWEDSWTWELRIEAWEPGRRLRLVQDEAPVYDAEGRVVDAPRSPGGPIVVEFTLEGVGGRTHLHLVHSGFGPAADWDDELDGISVGWQSELRGLRHYLERHRGRDRTVVAVRASSDASIETIWRRLAGGEGFALRPDAPRAGGAFEAAPPGGEPFTGSTELYIPDRAFFGVVPALGDAQFCISTHRAEGRTGMQVWLAAWNGRTPALDRFEAAARRTVDQLAGAR
jgi:uncharacterized protein YndB with AHSA1/START domain